MSEPEPEPAPGNRAPATLPARAAGLLLGVLAASASGGGESLPPTPADLYPGMFERVQMERAFEDGKGFADARPVKDPEEILEEYEARRADPDFDLRAFVKARFEPEEVPAESEFKSQPGRAVEAHIDALWPVLTHSPDEPVPGSSRLPLPFRYVVPGGRFQEIYYWDSYFTMLGLEESGRHDLTVDMVRNFAWLIDRYGHVPNGNRSYYVSRSQPPFFSLMVELVAARDGSAVYGGYLAQLRREYDFWMEGAESLVPGAAHRRVVRLADGTLLNRYWDDRDRPREESYRNDVETARQSGRQAAEVYRNLRAAAESGWDFSSRWLADGRSLSTIRTVDLIPVDLNSLLYSLEQTLARAYRVNARPAEASQFTERALERRRAIHRYLWNPRSGMFEDFDWRRRGCTGHVTAATLYPLFAGIATAAQANAVTKVVERELLEPDGLATTTVRTGQQWDAPNGWAPLQWIAIEGLNRYGHRSLAQRIAQRWVRENVAYYQRTGKLVEKYDVTGDAAASGGEYPLQDGFGWTNGVLRRLLALYPGAREPAAAREVKGAVE
jgi:alpha,alpha-trehalase